MWEEIVTEGIFYINLAFNHEFISVNALFPVQISTALFIHLPKGLFPI